MKYIGAYTLCVLGGKAAPSEDDVKKVLSEAGCEINAEELTKTVTALKGKALHDLIAAGQKKLATMSFGGGAGGSSAAKGGAGAAPGKKEEPKPAAKVEEKKEDTDVGLGGDLFGGEDW